MHSKVENDSVPTVILLRTILYLQKSYTKTYEHKLILKHKL